MIKVIASDMDGTLLGNDHKIGADTLEAIKKACQNGIRFMIVTGRNFQSAMKAVAGTGIVCDYILASGAEVRDPELQVVKRIPLSFEICRRVYEILKPYPVYVIYCTDQENYRIGTEEEADASLIDYIRLFHLDKNEEEIRKSEIFLEMKRNSGAAPDIQTLHQKKIPIYKIFLSSKEDWALEELSKKFNEIPGIAVASSFRDNLEITDIQAQKGPVLKEYIESLGYTMEEVMVLGDSMNDYSMLSMDFGATVAMENAMDEVKKVSRYVTKSNIDSGVAYAIEKVLECQ